MAINKSEQTLDKKLINDITDLKSQIIKIKGKQPVGADIVQVEPTQLITSSAVITAGSRLTFSITVTPVNQTLTLWNFSHSTYLDVNNPTNLYPGGSAFTPVSDQLKMIIFSWHDWALSDDVTNKRVYNVRYDATNCSSDHTIYFTFRSYIPKLSGTSV